MADRLAITEEPTDRLAIGDIAVAEPSEREQIRKSIVDDLFEDFLLEPDKVYDPLRQGQIASELLESLDEPANLKRDAENRLLLSNLFNIPLEDVMFMDKAMLKYMYNDELTSLKERFRKRPVEGGFFRKMDEAFKRGNENISSDIAMYEAVFEGRGNPQQVLEMRNKQQLEELLTPIEGNWLSDLFYKSGQIVPGMVRGYWDAIPEGFTGMVAGVAAAVSVGQAGPQVLLPEEIITVPLAAVIGFKAGFSAGAAQFWYKQGAGDMVASMLNEGYDFEISRTVAGVAAIPYALIELSQVSKLTPGLRKGISRTLSRSVARIMGAAVKKYGTTLTSEVVQEIQQEAIMIAAEDVSGLLSKVDIPFDETYIIDRSARLWETAVEATKAMALLPVPGMGIDVFTGVKGILPQAQRAEINSKLLPNPPLQDVLQAIREPAPTVSLTEAKAKLAAGTPLEAAEREQFPEIARQEDQITKLAKKPPPVAKAPPAKAPVAAKLPTAPVVAPPEVTKAQEAAEGLRPWERTPEEIETEKRLAEKVRNNEEFTAEEETVAKTLRAKSEALQKATAQQAATMNDVDFTRWENTRFISAIATEHDLAGMAKLIIALDLKGEAEKVKVVRNAINNSKKQTDPAQLRDRFPDEPESEIQRIAAENAEFNETLEITQELLEKHIPKAQPPTEAKPAEVGKPPTVAEKVPAKELPAKAPPVKAVLAVKIVSPGEAGPLQITLKPKEGVPATRIVVDPNVRKSIQASENKIGELKTKLRQAQADKKVAVIKATQVQIEKAEAKIAKLKERQNIKLANTIEQGRVKIARLRAAKKFSDKLRRDAISMVRAIPKDIQKDFFRRASEVTTLKGIEKLVAEIEAGIERIEKRGAIKDLNTAIKAIKPKKMLPEFAGPAQAIIESLQSGKLKEDTIVKNSDLKDMAQQVLDSAPRDEEGRIIDNIATFKAQQILDELRKKTAKTFAINQLSLDAIEQITDTLIALRFQNTVDTIAAQQEKATEAIRRRKLIKEQITEPPPGAKTPAGAVARKLKLIHDNLESVTDAVGGARPGTYDLWKARKRALTEFVYDVLDRGVDNQARHNKQAGDILRGILEDNGVTKKEIISWSIRPGVATKIKDLLGISVKPKLHTFTLEDARGKSTDFDFTVNELMSIFMHSRNSHNLAVLLNDGADRFVRGKIIKGEITKQKQKIRGFTIEIIDNMIASLTDQQKNVARQVGSKLMDGFNRDAINETSVKLVGFNIATVERYWPALRSIIRTLKGEAMRPALRLLENMGILKERVGIGNPMRLIGFFETTHTSNRNVSTYVGLAEPLREAKAVLSTDVLAEMEDSGRGAEKDRILKHIIMIEGQLVPVFETELEEIVSQMLGGFAKSKLFLNLKLAPRQQISEFLISAFVDPKYMAKFRGVSSKALIAEISEISPQMQARIEGFQFDRDIGDAFQQNELLNYLTGDLSLIDKTGLGMRFFDTNAIVDIYRATKAEVADKNPDIDIKSDEGKALLKDRFEWVVRHSQPIWHVKDRSLLGASRNPLVRTLTMFMSQREQLVRMVNNGISDFTNSEKTVEDAARLGRTLGTVTMNLVAFTLYNFAWALLIQRRKKDVKELARDFLKDILSLPFFGKYFAKSFEITYNSLTDRPVFNQEFDDGAVETILKEIMIDAIPNFARAGKHFVTGEKYQRGPNRGELKWENESLVAIDSLIDAFASLKGIPYYGAKDIFKTVKAQLPKD